MKMKFEEWIRLVDTILYESIGLNSHDLPDIDYWNMYNSNKTPKGAASKAIKAAQE